MIDFAQKSVPSLVKMLISNAVQCVDLMSISKIRGIEQLDRRLQEDGTMLCRAIWALYSLEVHHKIGLGRPSVIPS